MLDDARIAALRARVARLDPAQRDALRAQAEAAGVPWARLAPSAEAGAEPGAEPAADAARPPLAPAEAQFWLLQQLDPASTAHVIAFAWDIAGPLDRAALRRALAQVVARHEALRTGFPAEDGRPWRQVAAEIAVPLTESDPADPAAAEEAGCRFVAQPFDLARPPLFRAELQRLGPERHRLLFAFHHIVADGWSRGVFARDLAAAYRAARAGEAPRRDPLPSRGHLLRAGADWLAGPEARAQEAFWRAELAGLAPQDLPGRAGDAGRAAGTQLHAFPPDLAAQARRTAAELRATPFMLHLATFLLLLHRLGGGDDLAVGVPTAGRRAPEAAGMIGLFVNTLVVRAQPEPGMGFRDWLDHVRAAFARAFAHQDLPFARVVEAVGGERRAGRTPLFQALFQAQTDGYGRQNADTVDLGDPALAVRQAVLPLPEARFDLSWHLMDRAEGLSLIAEHRQGLFDAGRVARMARQYETLLAAAIAAPDTPIGDLALIPPGEAAALAAAGRGADAPIPDLSAMLAGLAAREDIALVCAETGAAWTGARLAAAAETLARRLCARPELAGGDARLALCLPRGPGLVVAILAALRAGLAYVPLDPNHPETRRAHILRDAGAGLMLATADVAAPCPVLDPATLEGGAETNPPRPDPEALAYLIYTSGSTGLPKGVPIARRSLANLLGAMAERPGFGAGDRLLALTTVAFDIAGLELLLPLSAGGTVVLAGPGTGAAPDRIAALIEAHGVTHLQATPAAWRLLVEAGWPGRPNLVALSGGEALPSDLGRALLGRVGTLWNLYGPTETTIWSAALRLTEAHLAGPLAPIGGPIANTTLRVLDARGAALPFAAPGELAIGGAGLSPGYRGRPDLTADRFRGAGAGRIYRTGDQVSLRPDGTLDFLGRLDHQIKLDGHRIEAGEVEAALTARPGIAAALVAAQDGRLVAWCRAEGTPPERGALRAALAVTLPAYMIPQAFVFLDAFPLNANGKIDRARLPAPDRTAPAEDRAPRTPAEVALHAIWAQVLGRADFGVEANFFDLGGASVTAMQIAARARAHGLTLTPAQMFDHQTIAAQAAAARSAPVGRTLPFSLWQAAQAGRDLRPWRMALAIPEGAGARLAEAAAALRAAHPVLDLGHEAGGWRTGAEPPAWSLRAEGEQLELTADPLLLDAPSAGGLLRQAADLLAGRPRPARAEGWLRWLAQPAVAPEPAPPFAGDGPETGDAGPVIRSAPPGAGLARTALALAVALGDWTRGAPFRLDLLAPAEPPDAALGQFTRLAPVLLRPGDRAATARAIEAALARGGADPRALPAGGVLLDWRVGPPPGIALIEAPTPEAPQGAVLHVTAEAGPDGLALTWRFDPARLRRASVERLAARHLAELATPAAADPLARLRAQIRTKV